MGAKRLWVLTCDVCSYQWEAATATDALSWCHCSLRPWRGDAEEKGRHRLLCPTCVAAVENALEARKVSG